MVREVLVKVLFGFVLVFLFGSYGVVFLAGYVVGLSLCKHVIGLLEMGIGGMIFIGSLLF
jgi:hypothetical protein